MGKLQKILELALHPSELFSVTQFFLFKEDLHPVDYNKLSKSSRRCYELLDATSRSFAAVIKQLNPELRNAIMIFYLILRALDTVEDDMNLDKDVKVETLTKFHEKLLTKDWSFTLCDETVKDRITLVEFPVILEEYHKLKPVYKDIIKNITDRMGNGMAEKVINEEKLMNGLDTMKEYNTYCYYVAGLVGESLTDMMLTTGYIKISEQERDQLVNSMANMLQKTNIIRDFREDLEEKRSFWPKEIWGKYVENYTDLGSLEYKDKTLDCICDLIIDALGHSIDVLTYLSGINDQSCFNFCAIPQVMAISTLELLYQNPLVFEKSVKIRKGTAVQLICESRTLQSCGEIFRRYVRKIHQETPVTKDYYLKVNLLCGKIEQFIESMNPTENLPKELLKNPPRSVIYDKMESRKQIELKAIQEINQEISKTKAFFFAISLSSLFVAYVIYAKFTGISVIPHVEL